eukprot:TRINITY_DN21828_c0_g1_i1.p1 TRINITY_DN21828_c0_g1~~TRINITY_DN21828_c0_g1_i1.p1  ORF type:complete len:934 (-),score=130.33 TRINITY_DN21828_c0_g1_i1:23-2824(-)
MARLQPVALRDILYLDSFFTCLDASDTILALGCNSGAVCVYSRASGALVTRFTREEWLPVSSAYAPDGTDQTEGTSSEMPKRIAIAPDESVLALATNHHSIVVVPLRPTTCTPAPAYHTQHSRSVTALAFAGDSLYSGDATGKVVRYPFALALRQPTGPDALVAAAHVALQEDAAVTQLFYCSAPQPLLVISTLHRSVIWDASPPVSHLSRVNELTERKPATVVGTKPRSGLHGACVAYDCVFASRPGGRVWKASVASGIVENTYRFAMPLGSNPTGKTQHLGALLPMHQYSLLAYDDTSVVLLSIERAALLCVDTFPAVLGVAVADEGRAAYVLHVGSANLVESERRAALQSARVGVSMISLEAAFASPQPIQEPVTFSEPAETTPEKKAEAESTPAEVNPSSVMSTSERLVASITNALRPADGDNTTESPGGLLKLRAVSSQLFQRAKEAVSQHLENLHSQDSSAAEKIEPAVPEAGRLMCLPPPDPALVEEFERATNELFVIYRDHVLHKAHGLQSQREDFPLLASMTRWVDHLLHLRETGYLGDTNLVNETQQPPLQPGAASEEMREKIGNMCILFMEFQLQLDPSKDHLEDEPESRVATLTCEELILDLLLFVHSMNLGLERNLEQVATLSNRHGMRHAVALVQRFVLPNRRLPLPPAYDTDWTEVNHRRGALEQYWERSQPRFTWAPNEDGSGYVDCLVANADEEALDIVHRLGRATTTLWYLPYLLCIATAPALNLCVRSFPDISRANVKLGLCPRTQQFVHSVVGQPWDPLREQFFTDAYLEYLWELAQRHEEVRKDSAFVTHYISKLLRSVVQAPPLDPNAGPESVADAVRSLAVLRKRVDAKIREIVEHPEVYAYDAKEVARVFAQHGYGKDGRSSAALDALDPNAQHAGVDIWGATPRPSFLRRPGAVVSNAQAVSVAFDDL